VATGDLVVGAATVGVADSCGRALVKVERERETSKEPSQWRCIVGDVEMSVRFRVRLSRCLVGEEAVRREVKMVVAGEEQILHRGERLGLYSIVSSRRKAPATASRARCPRRLSKHRPC
jgi:hypothetical protein